MIGLIVVGIVVLIGSVFVGRLFWDGEGCTFDKYMEPWLAFRLALVIWIVGSATAITLITAGIIINEQAHAEYSKYEASQYFVAIMEDEMDDAVDEMDEDENLSDLRKIIYEMSLQEGYNEVKEAMQFVAKVQYHNRRYWIFSKYWLIRDKVTDKPLSDW